MYIGLVYIMCNSVGGGPLGAKISLTLSRSLYSKIWLLNNYRSKVEESHKELQVKSHET